MAEEEENAANQNSEDGVQDTATQTAEDSAQQQADDASATANQNSQDGADKEQEGLKAAAVAEKKKRQEAEAQLQAVQNQNALLQQQMAARQQPNQPESTYAQALREAGLQDEPYITEEQRISVYERKEQLDRQKFQQQQQYAQNAQFMATHPDYAEVAGVDNPVTGQFIPSTELQTILTKKPWLFQAANASAQARYEIVINERALAAYEKTKTVMNEREVRQKADATTGPMSPSATGGGGAAANQFNSAEDVRAMEARIARGEFER